MGLGSWIQGRRDALKQSIAQRVVDTIVAHLDAWGATRWPVGWIRVRRAAVGWKTIFGAILYYAPQITDAVNQYAPSVIQAFGLDDAKTQGLIKVVGTILFALGLGDKYLKFTKPIERREGTRLVTSESGTMYALAPVSAPQNTTLAQTILAVPDALSAADKVAYDIIFNAEVKKGKTLEQARASAEDAVTKHPHP